MPQVLAGCRKGSYTRNNPYPPSRSLGVGRIHGPHLLPSARRLQRGENREPVPLHRLARSRSARVPDTPASLRKESGGLQSHQCRADCGALQCWSGSYWHVHHLRRPDEEAQGGGQSGHIQLCSCHEVPQMLHGSDRGNNISHGSSNINIITVLVILSTVLICTRP